MESFERTVDCKKKLSDMKSKEFYNFVEEFINRKIEKNSEEVRIIYHDVEIKLNADQKEIERFAKCSRIILEGLRLQSL